MFAQIRSRAALLAPAALILTMVGLSLVIGPSLPAKVPIHWLVSGEVDAFGSPAQACWLLPSLSLAVWLPLRAVRALERRRNRIAEILDHLVIGLTAWFTVIHATLLWQGPVPRVTAIGLVGLLAWSALLLVIPRSAPPPPQRRRATDWGPHTWT
jgi:hypothetical protein